MEIWLTSRICAEAEAERRERDRAILREAEITSGTDEHTLWERALIVIGASLDPILRRDICDALDLEHGGVSGALETLLKRGLVERGGRLRLRTYRITPAGRGKLAAMRADSETILS